LIQHNNVLRLFNEQSKLTLLIIVYTAYIGTHLKIE